jgi:hypothetical protein
MRLNRYVVILAVALLGVGIPMSRALADDTCTVSHEFTFDTDTEGWQFETVGGYVYGEYISGGLSQSYHNEPMYNNNLYTYYTFPNYSDDSVITTLNWSVTVTVTNDYGESGWLINQARALLDSSPINTDSTGVLGSTGTTTGSSIFTGVDAIGFHFSALAKDYYITSITLEATTSDGIDAFTGEACAGGGLGTGLTKPLAESALHPQWGLYDMQSVMDADPEGGVDSAYPNTVYGFSNTPNADVEAVAAGTVINVVPYTGADCTGAFVVFQSLRRCRVFVPSYISQESGDLVFNVELVSAYVVTVEDADDPNINYRYWLSSPVVSVGNDVVAGCILGKTIQLKNPTSFEISSFNAGITGSLSDSGDAGLSATFGGTANFRSLLVDAGVMTVTAIDLEADEALSLYPLLTEEPNLASCKASVLTNCTLDNPKLQSSNGVYPEGWGMGQGSILTGGGVHLLQGGSLIQSDVVISSTASYTLSVMARVTTPIDSFYPLTLKMGTATTTKQVTEGDYQLLVWTLGPREVTTTDVGVINQVDNFNAVDPVEVDIKYVCLSADTPTVTPGACVFANYQFDADSAGWTAVGGGIRFANGQAFVGDGGLLSQDNIQLFPNLDASPLGYTITALVRLNASGSYTGQVGKSIELKYKYPSTEPTYTSLGTIDATLVDSEGKNTYDGNVNIEHTYKLEDTLTISSATESTFEFGVLITDSDGYLKGLRIDSLCITPNTDDGSFPNPDPTGPFKPPTIAACAVIPTPEDNNISSWTYYHWKNLERFFNCTLMIKINQMYNLINDAWKTTRLFMRWTVVLVNRVGDWFTSFVWWLNGSFRNIAVGQVTTVYQSGGGQCSDLFCVLDNLISSIFGPVTDVINTLLDIVTAGANLFFTISTGLIGLALAFLTRVMGFFNQASALLTGLLTSYNTATPTAIEGLPVCNVDPDSSLFCQATWLFDNTILSGRWGILITLLLGYLGIHLILWVIGEFKGAIVTTGGSS